MVCLFKMSDLTILWLILGFAAIGLIAWLCYRFIPGIRPQKKDVDENEIAKEELDRILVPMDENDKVEEEKDEDVVVEAKKDVKEDKKQDK